MFKWIRSLLNKNKIRIALSYRDVYLEPQKTIVNSRDDCDTWITFGGNRFKTPIIPSNMPSVIDENTCLYLYKNSTFYIYHRYGLSPLEFYKFCEKNAMYCSISVGINIDSKIELLKLLERSNGYHPHLLDYITIDVANAFNDKTAEMIKWIKQHFPRVFLIVGNVATKEGVKFLDKAGANCIKLSVGDGFACTTKDKTGFHIPTLQAIMDAASVTNRYIIADGGIRKIGDIAKGLVYADMIMAGWLFAGYDQSAKTDEYYGNASDKIPGKDRHIEGHSIPIEKRGNMAVLLKDLQESLKSSISYAGGKNIQSLKKAKLIKVR